MLSSVWREFLIFFEKNQKKSPIVFSVLKQLKPVELTEKKLVLACENLGVKMYLEKKIPLVEGFFSSFLHKKTILELVVKQRKRRVEPPLFSFQPSIEESFIRAGLNNKYRFDNFAVSSTNQVAYAACQAVVANPGASYNPLFLCGGVGVGKTHLAQAAARAVLEKNSDKKIFFCPGDQFTNELIESIREKNTASFRRKYRRLDFLVVDDIQFIAGKETVQEEFFHTFNAVVSLGGQIILTSDRPPAEIKKLEDRLRSRFSGGLIVDIQPPDFELRTAILLIKAKEKNIEIDIDAAKIISDQVVDCRALEGTLLSVYAKMLGKKEKIDIEAVESFFQEKNKNQVKKPTPSDIIRAVCSYYNIRPSHVKGPTRTDNVVLPRQIIMFFLRQELKMKYEEIAFLLKRKDHTTIIHGVEKISSLLIKNPLLKKEIDSILGSLQSST